MALLETELNKEPKGMRRRQLMYGPCPPSLHDDIFHHDIYSIPLNDDSMTSCRIDICDSRKIT